MGSQNTSQALFLSIFSSLQDSGCCPMVYCVEDMRSYTTLFHTEWLFRHDIALENHWFTERMVSIIVSSSIEPSSSPP